MKIYLSLIVTVFFVGVFAETITIEENRDKDLFEVISSDLIESEIEFSLLEFDQQEITENGNTYLKISCFNEGKFLESGKPDLPRFSRLIAIPDQGGVDLEISGFQSRIISETLVYPQQELKSESQINRQLFYRDEEFYNSGSIYPNEIVELGSPAILRDLRVVRFTVNPFRFDPVNKELELITNISLKITANDRESQNPKTRNSKRSRFFEPLYNATVLNYEATLSRDEEYQVPTYLYIHPNNSTIESYLEPLLEWKKRKGFNVIAVNTAQTGSSNSQIKNYIQELYDSENPPEFVCFVGDASGSYTIPTWFESYSSYGGEGDHPYSQLDGYDILADVYLGRISISSPTDLLTYVDKVMNYEKEPYLGNTSWYERALLVGDPSSSGESCITTKLAIKEMILFYESGFNFFEVYNGSWTSQMANGLNNGVTYFNYRGYLNMSGWNNSHINSLNNGYMLPLAVFLTCGTGDFYNETSRSEAFIRAGSPSTPKGAIAAVGTATWGTHTVFNNSIDAGTYYGVFQDGIYNPGGALTMGKLNLYLNFPNNSYYVNIFSHWNTMMGDPGVDLWTAIPQELIVNHVPEVGLETGYITVLTTDHYENPLSNIWVSAWKEGLNNDEVFVSCFTDDQGYAHIPLPQNAEGEVYLTATGHNFIPYLGSFEISPQDVWITVRNVNIDDDNFGTSSGNGNGEINPGESIELAVGLRNTGLNNSGYITASLEAYTENVIIEDSFEEYGIIGSGEIVYSDDDFDIAVPMTVLGGEEIILRLIIESSNDQEWIEMIYLQVLGPHLVYDEYDILDGGNGILDPDEEAELVVDIFNAGAITIENVTGILSCDNELITVEDSTGYYGIVPAEETVSNTGDPFMIKASAQALPGMQIPFILNLSNDLGYQSEITFFMDIGTVNQGDPLGPDLYGYFCYDDGDESYDIAPEYVWIEIDPYQSDPDYNGTTLPMSDYGNDGDIEVIQMPFSFNFYGMPYDEITVCSNGWIAPGVTEQYCFMNWHIPGPIGPSPMIAPFWDDLKMSSGHVCYYYVEDLHYFIVEWSNLTLSESSNLETFEVIIYDPEYYETPSGDADLLFQYKVVHNYDNDTTEGPYCTVGIEDHTGTMGLEYTFRNLYPTAAKTLEYNMALLFTTRGSTAMAPAEIVLSDDHFNFALQTGGTDNDILLISNNGEQNLYFNFVKEYLDFQSDYNYRGSGGPDNYGYQWVDSNEDNGPEYNWRDIEGLGTQVTFPHNDEGTELIPLDFTFNYYGEDYTSFRINPNGWIGFGNDSSEWLNTPIPSPDAPLTALMPYWDDLYPYDGEEGGGNVFYYSTPDSLVIWFDNVIHYPGAHNGTYDFQAIIYPSGEILYQYKEVSGDIDTVTIGMQNEEGDDGLQVVYNQFYVENELAIKIKKIIDWVTIEPSGGILPEGESQPIQISVDSEELEYGQYLCNLVLYTNDPNNSETIIPVSLVVVSELPDLTVSEESLNFGEIEIGQTVSDTLVAQNDGVDQLIVNYIDIDNQDYDVSISEFILNSGESIELIVSFNPTELGQSNGVMTIFSNDPAEPELEIELAGEGIPVSGYEEDELPDVTTLFNNYPNPFNPETEISFQLAATGPVILSIYNLKGQMVTNLIDGIKPAGKYSATWNGRDLNGKKVPSGIYLYSLYTKDFQAIKKMILIK